MVTALKQRTASARNMLSAKPKKQPAFLARMGMEAYLDGTRTATTALFQTRSEVRNELFILSGTIQTLEKKLFAMRTESGLYDICEDDEQSLVKTYLGRSVQERNEKIKCQRILTALKEKKPHVISSEDATAMFILQLAKQGLSTVHQVRNPAAAPQGRIIQGNGAAITLTEILWYGRNQAAHVEDQAFNKHTQDAFDRLNIIYPGTFDVHTPPVPCFANAVLDVLMWNNYETYRADMLLLQ